MYCLKMSSAFGALPFAGSLFVTTISMASVAFSRNLFSISSILFLAILLHVAFGNGFFVVLLHFLEHPGFLGLHPRPEIKDYIFLQFQTPNTAEEWEEKAEKFATRWQFFNCIGAIDGKYVVIQAPEDSG